MEKTNAQLEVITYSRQMQQAMGQTSGLGTLGQHHGVVGVLTPVGEYLATITSLQVASAAEYYLVGVKWGELLGY